MTEVHEANLRYFSQIHIEGFRRLFNFQLELRPLCVLVGANSSGKTSLLDAFSLVADSAKGRLKQTLSNLGGIAANLTGGDARWMAMKVSATTNKGEPIHYRLALQPQGIGYEIVDEALYLQTPDPPGIRYIKSQHGATQYLTPQRDLAEPESFESPRREPEPGETALSADRGAYANSVNFAKQLASVAYYHALDVGPQSPVRLPQPLRPADLPGANGEDLVSCLYSIRENDRDRFDEIQDTLRVAFPGFERLEFPPVAAGTLAMTWRDKISQSRFTPINFPKARCGSCGWGLCCKAQVYRRLPCWTSRKSACTRSC